MIPYRVLSERVTRIQTDVLVIGIFQNIRPLEGPAAQVDWYTCGILSSLILRKKIQGAFGERTLLATERKIPASKVLVIGLGESDSFERGRFEEACRATALMLNKMQTRDCVLELFGINAKPRTLFSPNQAMGCWLEALNRGPVSEGQFAFLVSDPGLAASLQQHLNEMAGHA